MDALEKTLNYYLSVMTISSLANFGGTTQIRRGDTSMHEYARYLISP